MNRLVYDLPDPGTSSTSSRLGCIRSTSYVIESIVPPPASNTMKVSLALNAWSYEDIQSCGLGLLDQDDGMNSGLFGSLTNGSSWSVMTHPLFIGSQIILTFRVRSLALSDQTAGTLSTNSFSQSLK